MPKTRELKVGRKTYTLREQPSAQMTDWFMLQMKRMAKLDKDSDLYHNEQMRVQNELCVKMVVAPHITLEYFEGDDATIDDTHLGLLLMKEIQDEFEDLMEEKQVDIKKK